MTPEEKADLIARNGLGHPMHNRTHAETVFVLSRDIAQAIRKAKAEAYEEAAQIAAIERVEWQRGLYHEDDAIDAGHQIAARVRTLKDSLAQEEVVVK